MDERKSNGNYSSVRKRNRRRNKRRCNDSSRFNGRSATTILEILQAKGFDVHALGEWCRENEINRVLVDNRRLFQSKVPSSFNGSKRNESYIKRRVSHENL